MELKFTIDTSGIAAVKESIASACSRAEHAVAVQIAKDTAPFVPMLTGSLRTRTRVTGNEVIYPGPYARYLYYGKLYVDPLTGSSYARKGVTKVPAVPEKDLIFHKPGTCSHWFEASKAQNMEKWVRVAEKAVKSDF
nr:MAG TPA: Minor capsid protein [Caudoviricetes sp.]